MREAVLPILVTVAITARILTIWPLASVENSDRRSSLSTPSSLYIPTCHSQIAFDANLHRVLVTNRMVEKRLPAALAAFERFLRATSPLNGDAAYKGMVARSW